MTCTDCEHFFKIGYNPPLGKCREYTRVTRCHVSEVRSPAELLESCPLVEKDRYKLMEAYDKDMPGRRSRRRR